MTTRFLLKTAPLSILLIFLSINTILSQTKDWIGGTGNWDVGANWNPAGVPVATDRVTITGVGDVTIPASVNAVAKDVYMSSGADLTVASTATLSINGATEDGINLQGSGTTLTNSGTIRVGNVSAVYRNGIALFEGQMTNTASGLIEIDRITFNIGLALTTSPIRTLSTCVNDGSIRIGQNAAVNAAGIFVERSTFTNGATGSIQIANITTVGKGVVVYGDNATTPSFTHFSNYGTISATTTGLGLDYQSSFQNNLNATINVGGLSIWNNSTFNNLSTITAGSIGVVNRSQFTNSSTATLISGTIDINQQRDFTFNETLNETNYSRMTNSGILRVTANVYVGILVGTALFTNTSTGSVEINNVTKSPYANESGAIEVVGDIGFAGYSPIIGRVVNAGSIRIGNLSAVAEDGILVDSRATFENTSTGSIEINNITEENGINAIHSPITNSGLIRIGNLSPISKIGIKANFLTNNAGATIEIDNISTSTGKAIYTELTPVINNGTLKIGKNSSVPNGIVLYRANFTNGPDAVLEIDRVSGFGGAAISIDNQFGTLQFNNSGIIRIGQTIGVSSYGIFINGGINFINQSTGTVEINNVTQHSFTGTAILLNGISYAATFTNSGTLRIGNTGDVKTGIRVSGSNASFTNNSGATVEIDRIIGDQQPGVVNDNGTFSNAGNLKLSTNTTGTVRLSKSFGSTVITNTGTITLGNTVNNGQPITNNGTIQVNAGRTFYNLTAITNNTNAIFKGNGSLFYGNLTFNAGSIIAPGASPGTMTVATDLNLGSATYQCEINGTTASTDYDVLAVTGSATLTNATLDVVWGFMPAVGNTFRILTCTSRTGQFSAVNIPAVMGRNFTVQYLTTSVVIEVTASVLSVELSKFSAKQENSKAELTWQTANEVAVKNFDIEKGTDGKTFSKIAEVKAHNTPSVYQAFDDQFSESAYYRLKINDLDGTSKYSNIVFLEKNGDKTIKIRRNTEGSVFVETNDKIESVVVSNSIGQVLKTTKDSRLSLADLPKGIYIVSVKTDKAFMSEKVFHF